MIQVRFIIIFILIGLTENCCTFGGDEITSPVRVLDGLRGMVEECNAIIRTISSCSSEPLAPAIDNGSLLEITQAIFSIHSKIKAFLAQIQGSDVRLTELIKRVTSQQNIPAEPQLEGIIQEVGSFQDGVLCSLNAITNSVNVYEDTVLSGINLVSNENTICQQSVQLTQAEIVSQVASTYSTLQSQFTQEEARILAGLLKNLSDIELFLQGKMNLVLRELRNIHETQACQTTELLGEYAKTREFVQKNIEQLTIQVGNIANDQGCIAIIGCDNAYQSIQQRIANSITALSRQVQLEEGKKAIAFTNLKTSLIAHAQDVAAQIGLLEKALTWDVSLIRDATCAIHAHIASQLSCCIEQNSALCRSGALEIQKALSDMAEVIPAEVCGGITQLIDIAQQNSITTISAVYELQGAINRLLALQTETAQQIIMSHCIEAQESIKSLAYQVDQKMHNIQNGITNMEVITVSQISQQISHLQKVQLLNDYTILQLLSSLTTDNLCLLCNKSAKFSAMVLVYMQQNISQLDVIETRLQAAIDARLRQIKTQIIENADVFKAKILCMQAKLTQVLKNANETFLSKVTVSNDALQAYIGSISNMLVNEVLTYLSTAALGYAATDSGICMQINNLEVLIATNTTGIFETLLNMEGAIQSALNSAALETAQLIFNISNELGIVVTQIVKAEVRAAGALAGGGI